MKFLIAFALFVVTWVVLALIGAFVVGSVQVIAQIYQRWRADRSDPYVTLSEMRHRLKPLTKKD